MHKKELRDLFISIVALGVIFSISDLSLTNLVASLFVVGLAFLCHELAHRETARKFGAHATYRIWPTGLLIALVLGVISGGRIIFAVPGVVYISAVKVARWKTEYTSLKNEEYGLISVAGPLANLVLSLVFLAFNSLYSWNFFAMAAMINIYIAFFNLLPVPPFDGAKVMRWDRKTWAMMFLAALVGLIGTWFL